MKRTLLTLSIYAVLATYPAYTQVSAWANSYLNQWAAERVVATMPVEVQTAMKGVK